VTEDILLFKEVMSRFATGVTVVTGIDQSEPVGFTCQSFASVSIDPPLVVVAPARSSTSWPKIAKSGHFCVNVLGETQSDVCSRFAVSGGSKFSELSWHSAPISGSPKIEGCIAWIDCRIELVHDAGDHELILGRVLHLALAEGAPLIFFRRALASIHRNRWP
jgi:3-hydroxy-9,10-secoandrosta-1,3,5(10)-triene-9,17-dione monooxygenase reductase component